MASIMIINTLYRILYNAQTNIKEDNPHDVMTYRFAQSSLPPYALGSPLCQLMKPPDIAVLSTHFHVPGEQTTLSCDVGVGVPSVQI